MSKEQHIERSKALHLDSKRAKENHRKDMAFSRDEQRRMMRLLWAGFDKRQSERQLKREEKQKLHREYMRALRREQPEYIRWQRRARKKLIDTLPEA